MVFSILCSFLLHDMRCSLRPTSLSGIEVPFAEYQPQSWIVACTLMRLTFLQGHAGRLPAALPSFAANEASLFPAICV